MDNEEILTCDQAKDYASGIHNSRYPLSDVLTGIEKFTQYVWRDLPVFSLPLSERQVHQPLVNRYAEMIDDFEIEMPPLIYDDVDDCVIDGLHRLEAARQSGLAFIPAWVGIEQNLRE